MCIQFDKFNTSLVTFNGRVLLRLCKHSPKLFSIIASASRNTDIASPIYALMRLYPDMARKEALTGIDRFFKELWHA